MNIAALVFINLTIFIHIFIFIGESLLWMTPLIYEKVVSKIDVATTASSYEQAQILEVLFFNQGFYNLLIALGGIAALILYRFGKTQEAIALVSYICLFAMAAGAALAASTTAYPAASIQGLPPFFALLCLYLSRRTLR